MGRYIVRRLITAIPTLIAISMVIFAILALATSPADLSVVYGTAGQVATVHVLIDVQGYYD